MRLPLALRRAGAVTGAATLLTAAGLASGVIVGVASAQAATSISPSAVSNATTGATTFTINGSGFTGALDTVTLVPTDVTYSDEVKTISATVSPTASTATALSVTATLTLAAPEPYDVVVSQPGVPSTTVSTCSSCLVVTNPGRPTVTGVTNNGGGGAFAVSGTNFAIGAKVEFLKPDGTVDPDMVFSPGSNTTSNGQTTHNTGYASSTKITGSYTSSTGVTPGEHLIRVTNTDAQFNRTTTAEFWQPTFTSVSPAVIGEGASNVPLTLTGAGIRSGSSIGVSQYSSTVSDATVGTATVSSDNTSIVAPVSFTTDGTAQATRTVSIQGADGGYTSKAAALTTTLAPTVDSQELSKIGQGGSLAVTITGTGFGQNVVFSTTTPKVTFKTTFVKADGSSAIATMSATSDAPVGDLTTLTATNSDGGAGSYVEGDDNPITDGPPITVDAAPMLTEATTAQPRTAGKSGQVAQLTGTGFVSGMTVNLGAGITVTNVVINSATSATVTFTTAANATAGPRDVILTNTDKGTSTCTGCFGIDAMSVSPTADADTDSDVDVTVTAASGASFAGATGIVLSKEVSTPDQPDIAGTGVAFSSSSKGTATFDLTNAAPGLYNVTVTVPGGTVSCSGCFTVTGHSLTVTSIAPATGGQGATEFPITLTGTGFVRGESVTIAGTTVDNVAFVSPTSLTAKITIPSSTAVTTTKLDVTVTNSDGNFSGVDKTAYAIVAAPTVTKAATSTPDKESLGQGATGQVVKLTGTGFTAGSVASFDGTGVTVTNTSLVSGTELDVTVSVASDAPIGARGVTVSQTDNGGTSTPLASAITITAAPVASLIAPASVVAGSTNQVSLSGQGFESGATITAADVTFTNVMTNGDGTLTATAAVAAAADGGSRTVRVVNPDGGSATCACSLIVQVLTKVTMVTSTHSTAGDLVVASGVLTNANTGADLASLPVSVTIAPRVGSSTTVTSNSSSSGAYSRSLHPTYTSIISAYYLGDSTHTAASAKNITDTVSPNVLITSPGKGSSSKSSTTLTIRGSVSPNLAGHIIGLYREFKTGYKGIAQATIASNGTYTVSVKLNKGSYYLKTGVGASTGNPAGFSTALLVKRT